ncbi:cytochrome o ubiquinol oxidase subunit I [Candidatus Protochlamydia phocaeensis]|uniref:cytochrome o ubiquinol oxidase subunit I n=1 Tax=Candidatus Protochlamydia phocaeensis TaxID=1414722 RepID=UPI0008387126|nr:cytochrome o ubiquinol oxidase subunit I [Candidatus Protochlamydia phocaeensis]
MFGKLTEQAFIHNAIEDFVGMGIIAVSILLIVITTYFKRWKWLWHEWITTVDPKRIGIMYLVVVLLMLFKGVTEASMMRVQQAISTGDSHGFLAADHFQQIFSAHGTTMIFFVAMGVFFGLMNLIIPLQIGARDVAFPFLNSVSFWLFAVGAMLLNISMLVGKFSETGWLAYPPLSGLQFSPGEGVDYWIWIVQISGIGSLLAGINFLVTILKMRCPGMTLMKMPLFVWTSLGSLILVLFAFPILTATLFMLSFDRILGMHFFTADGGGNFMMYINLIWAWGHPEVYILILPIFGIYSEVVATFSEKRLFGYTAMVWATMAIAFYSYIVWVHHFFTMGAGPNINAFFGIMTAIIAIPTGVKIFNWLFTMYRGRVHFTTPMLWFFAFLFSFSIGGIAGVLLSIPAADFQVHNSLFLIAHFHAMVIGGVLFGFFSGYSYWFPKVTGFKLNETLGHYAFWFWFIGYLIAFMPLYVLGFMGATRRLDHYELDTGWQPLFITVATGVIFIILGILFQNIQLFYSIWKRKEYKDVTGDPWNGRTLEWSIPSPPPIYNFALIPQVEERDSFWATKLVRKNEHPQYEDIYMPKNTPMGFFIGVFSLFLGFALVWQIWWLVIAGLLGNIACLIIQTSKKDSEYVIPAEEVAKIEASRKQYA